MPHTATPHIPPLLPPQPTRLIGREDELGFINGLLSQDDVRLVTLIGPGGIGKTRLAIAAAERAADRFPDGVWFVDLAPLADPALVLPTIAQVLGVREQRTQDARDALKAFLGKRLALLVVDNLEHLLAAASDLDLLIAACPRLTILATSREPLRLRREHLFEVRPLPAPGAEPASWTIANLAGVPTVQLFVARAQSSDADFELTEGNVTAVAELGRRLEGLPLAIELAAARIRVLEPEALLARMNRSLTLLRWEAPDLPTRHRSLRATFDWSHALLTPDQQVLFRRLAVFAGGFTLDGAEAVFTGDVPGAEAGAGDGLYYQHPEPPSRPSIVLEDMATLLDHGLVQRIDPVAEEPRFRLLETVRQYALERLAEVGEDDIVRHRHLAYLVRLAEDLAERIWTPEAEQALAQLDAVHDDMRVALSWAEASGEAALGLRLARAQINYWVVRNHLREGQNWLERALAWGQPPLAAGGGPAGEPVSSAERARALVGLGWLASLQGDPVRAVALSTEGLQIAVAVGAQLTAATAWDALGLAHLYEGCFAEAATCLDEALARFRQLEPELVAGPQYVSHVSARRGHVAFAAGDLPGASHHLAEAERRQRALGFAWGLCRTLRHLGEVARARGDLDEAQGRYQESVTLAQTLGDPGLVAEALESFASVASAQGHAERAARLHGAAAAVHERLGAAVLPWERIIHEHDLTEVRAALGEAPFAAAWAAGATLPLEDAVAEALADPGLAPADGTPAADPAAALGLTTREIEVLRLLGHGRSNREIGEALFISPRTANFHVTNLLAKLGLDSRAAAAAFAVRHGLA